MSDLQPGELDIQVEHAGAAAVVRVAGEIDIATAPELVRVLEGVQYAGGTVAVDLGDVVFMDSTALKLLLSCQRRAERAGATFVVRNTSGIVLRAIQMAGLETTLNVERDGVAGDGDHPRGDAAEGDGQQPVG